MSTSIEFIKLRSNLEALKRELLPQNLFTIRLEKQLPRFLAINTEKLLQRVAKRFTMLYLPLLLELKARLQNPFALRNHRLTGFLQTHVLERWSFFELRLSHKVEMQQLSQPNVFAVQQPLDVLAEPMARFRLNIWKKSNQMIIRLRVSLNNATIAEKAVTSEWASDSIKNQ